MPTFTVNAYRYEGYMAVEDIEAETAEAALEKAKQLDEAGDLDFSDYVGNAQPADAYTIDNEEGDRVLEHETQDYFMEIHGDELLDRAAAVCSLWATGDLAAAVRELQETVDKIIKKD